MKVGEMVPMMFNCKENCRNGSDDHHKQTPRGAKRLSSGLSRIKMKRWGNRPYSRSVHYTESILLARLPKVKNICPGLNRFFAVFPTSRRKSRICWQTHATRARISPRGHGGIGRLGGFRFHCESVQVRVLLPAPDKKTVTERWLFFYLRVGSRTRTHLNASVRGTLACRRLDGGNTIIFFPAGRKCISSPVARTNKGNSEWYIRCSLYFLLLSGLEPQVRVRGARGALERVAAVGVQRSRLSRQRAHRHHNTKKLSTCCSMHRATKCIDISSAN